jgi:hypothetical protein
MTGAAGARRPAARTVSRVEQKPVSRVSPS